MQIFATNMAVNQMLVTLMCNAQFKLKLMTNFQAVAVFLRSE
jgi:hypothetical protein